MDDARSGRRHSLGGLLARLEHIQNKHLHKDLVARIGAFGGGAMVAAIVLVLVPEAKD